MRSSERANSASIAVSVRIRCLPGNSQMVAKAKTQNAISSGDQRARRPRYDDTSPAASLIASPRRATGKQTLRPPDQHNDHERVDHKGAEFWHVILAGDICDPEQDRGKERAGNAGGAADAH